LILRAMVPSLGSSVLNLAVDPSVDQAVVEYLEQHADVVLYDTEDQLLKRVRAMDDVFGIQQTGDRFGIVREGNETEGMEVILKQVLNAYANQDIELPAEIRISDIGWKLPPLKQFGGSLLVVFVSFFGGMIIMMNIVEEKQSNTLSAINVTSVSRPEYVVGKGLLGFVIPIFHSFVVLLIMGFTGLNFAMVTMVVISIALISVIVGFMIGVLNDNVISAASSMKALFVPILASVFGGIYLADKWQPLLYWSPFYWAYDSMNRIILGEATWFHIVRNSGIILALTAVVFAFLSKRIARGLN
jgi:ABC-2 type transport system permease protein